MYKYAVIFFLLRAYSVDMERLERERSVYHTVRQGQSLKAIAEFFCVSERAIITANGLAQEPKIGQILIIPKECGNGYIVKDGDNKTLLCGSDNAYERKNGTKIIYPGMRVIL